jgi:type IV pilus assembly protein PilW
MSHPIRTARGFTLIELLVATAIGVVLLVGAVRIYSDSSKTYGIHETQARLEENARYVYSVLEPDLRMAGYWGLTKGSAGLAGTVPQTATAATALAGSAATTCGNNFPVDLATAVEGTNDSYSLACAPGTGTALPSADTLTVRRAAQTLSAVAANVTGPLRVCATRISATLLNNASTCPTTPVGVSSVRDLIVHTYYVANASATAGAVPTLWRKSLNTVGVTPTFQDEEILPGVEDLQVQLGIDPSGTTGIASQYVDPVTAANIPAGAQVVSVRLWILVRADQPETGFVDSRIYAYANRAVANGTVSSLATANAGKAYQPNDNYRRLLVSRTVQLRNALGT